MKKLRRIIKDIVKQQIEFAEKTKNGQNEEYIRQLTYKQISLSERKL